MDAYLLRKLVEVLDITSKARKAVAKNHRTVRVTPRYETKSNLVLPRNLVLEKIHDKTRVQKKSRATVPLAMDSELTMYCMVGSRPQRSHQEFHL
jgi:hypothetical protein